MLAILLIRWSLLLAAVIAPAAIAPAQDTGASAYVWSLAPLFVDHAHWQAEMRSIARELAAMKGAGFNLADRASFTREMARVTLLRQGIANATNYTLLLSLLDITSTQAHADFETAVNLESEVSSDLAPFDAAVCKLGPVRINSYVHADPSLRVYMRRLNATLRSCSHALSAGKDDAVLQWQQESGNLWEALFDHSIQWQSVELSGSRHIAADRRAYLEIRARGDQSDRSIAIPAYFEALNRFIVPLGTLFVERLAADHASARLHHFRDGFEAAQFDEGMPAQATTVMFEEMRSHLSLLRRYLRLRAKVLGISDPNYFDLFVTPPVDHRFSVAETYAIAHEVAAPVGPAYQARMSTELAKPWNHLPPWPQKRDTYGAWGNFIGGRPSFGFMRYEGTYDDSSRLTGLIFSMMAKATMPANRPTDQREDPAVYGNAILRAGRMWQNDYLIAHASASAVRMAYLIFGLDALATAFEDTLRAEFAWETERQIAAGATPTGGELSSRYDALLEEYYGGLGGYRIPAMQSSRGCRNRTYFMDISISTSRRRPLRRLY